MAVAGAVELAAGRSVATLYPSVGGRLGQLDLGDGPLLRGPGAGLEWMAWGCYPLVPWSNRVPGGRLRFGAIDARLPVNSPDGSAIHGLVADRPWSVVAVTPTTAELTIAVDVDPYRIVARQVVALVDGALDLVVSVTNAGGRMVPVGLGIHPWFRAGRVVVPAELVWPGEPLPIGPPEPVSARRDLRHGAVPEPMDACFGGLTEAAVEAPGVRLGWDGPVTHVVVYSGEPGWVCLEPVTMANDGFALAARGVAGHGVRELEEGATLSVAYRFERT